MSKETKLPLCVDLDGTLIRSDVTHESVLLFIRKYPWKIFNILIWLGRGRAFLKARLADYVLINPALLPYNKEFLTYIKDKEKKGFDLYLVTAADQKCAKIVHDYLGIFKQYLASDGNKNLRALNKSNVLCERFGFNHFIYAGNSCHDLPVWENSAEIIAVNTPKKVTEKIKFFYKKIDRFQDEPLRLKEIFKEIILYPFSRNFLFWGVPMIVGNYISYKEQMNSFRGDESLFIAISLFFLNIATVLLARLFYLNEIRINLLTKESLLSTSRLTIVNATYLSIILMVVGFIVGKSLPLTFLISFVLLQFFSAIRTIKS